MKTQAEVIKELCQMCVQRIEFLKENAKKTGKRMGPITIEEAAINFICGAASVVSVLHPKAEGAEKPQYDFSPFLWIVSIRGYSHIKETAEKDIEEEVLAEEVTT